MKWSEIPINTNAKVLRQFAAAWLIFFLAFGVHQYLVRGHRQAGLALGVMALVFGGLGLWRPATVRWLFVSCTVLAFPIGWVVSQLMLMLMFYALLTPMALAFRLLGRDVLVRKPMPKRESFWTPRPAPPEVRSYFRQY